MMIFARALQGIAGATIAPSTLSLIVKHVSGRDRAQQGNRYLGHRLCCRRIDRPADWWSAARIFSLGLGLSVNVPIMAALLISAPRLLPEYRNENAGQLDLASVALSLAAVLPVIFGLKELAANGVQLSAFLPVAAGIVFGILFIRRQRSLKDPLIDLDLFRIPGI